ncbi:DUF4827 family protein [Dysgonomonas sp. 520]|uniref:DUF4827 family protein n=1 Tax=Dysgonomonas sp. 520 TaxID=2302931 RepID=UPI0013D26AE1|nr:DUF4827 family protein [Dysgonomonas sp. 520]NDW08135.1 DUF4827 family protein [Dysgonomonas sp. 520]
MKKYIGLTFVIAAISLIFMSCDNGVSYADRLKKERKLISEFIAEKGFEVRNGFPADSVFEKGVYYKDPKTGIYLSILDYGDLEHKASASNRSMISYRFNTRFFLASDSVEANFPANQSAQFHYLGDEKTLYANKSTVLGYTYMSYTVAMPLKYVGEGGIVSVIAPFNYGSAYQQEAYEPLWLNEIKYYKIW